MTIATLQDQLNSRSDAKLRTRIDERIDPLREYVVPLPEIEFEATGQNAQPVTVTLMPAKLIDVLRAAAFDARQNQARLRETQKFLKRVEARDVQP